MSNIIYTALPDDNYRPFKRKRREREPNWVAPEHQRFASHMGREYRIAHDGRKMVELGKELILNPLPDIMRKQREPIFLGLDK